MYIFPHNENWAYEYAKESEHISQAFADEIELFHIGSTAVKNLVAKDCIDILGVVKNLSLVQERREDLIVLGYVSKGEYGIKGREYFTKTSRKVHLHIYKKCSPEIKKHLNFVEIMRSHPGLVAELSALKRLLHGKYPNNKEQYQQDKIHFYNDVHKMF